jgi:acetyltransferase-like isoleucine patch superfamily enzyme
VEEYQGLKYQPRLIIGSSVSISNWTHLSCASRMMIGDGCLIGSKVYIGDHNHGMPGPGPADGPPGKTRFPGDMPLVDLDEVEIGRGTWVGDGAVILGGCSIAPCSIIGANSVVMKVREQRAALIAGVPARVVKYLD